MSSMKTFLAILAVIQASLSISMARYDNYSIEGGIEPIPLPYTWDSGITCYYIDLDLLSEGYQQSIIVEANDLVVAEIKFQRWSIYGSDRVNQLFLLYSWSRSWNPPTHYLPLWFGISGDYPGITRIWRYTFKVPGEPGVYYVWIRGDYATGMEEAVANIWYMYRGPPPYNDDGGGIIGKIIVTSRGDAGVALNVIITPILLALIVLIAILVALRFLKR
ncbi:MAG: hypothetical protein RMJ00_00665 [Nitrososphaerota archaeon]|nr:hypothetical protein [Candidatus Bathyarchaeota archaeon]MCX8161632.1 hypothetical protein [Candidatus Bathyarchaeota archaeon]MDW8061202.1 hypothetical protein [Nitrososphaerota archaeon]